MTRDLPPATDPFVATTQELESLRRALVERDLECGRLKAEIARLDAIVIRTPAAGFAPIDPHELLHLRLVFEAAKAWREQYRAELARTLRRSPDPMYVRVPDEVDALARAIDAALTTGDHADG